MSRPPPGPQRRPGRPALFCGRVAQDPTVPAVRTIRTVRDAAGDLFMSLIHTCELNNVNAFEYLVAVLRNHTATEKKPAAWMPWTYRETLQQK